VPKILAQAGMSLADLYDIEGSIVGVDQLDADSVTLVHEMGTTLFSERLSGSMRRGLSGSILQSVNWDFVITDLPTGIWRVLSVMVVVSPGSRIDHAQLSMRSPRDGREVPFWNWESGNNVESSIRIVENDSAAGNTTILIPSPTELPAFGLGRGQPQLVNEIAFRGRSSAFGAGTVDATAVLYIAHTQLGGGITNKGLPVPSW